MPEQQTIWHWIQSHLTKNRKLILMMVIASQGSSPGKTGAKLAIAEDGTHFGTIGGGAVEHKLINKAVSLLNTTSESELKPILMREYHHPSVNKEQSGMICGGEQTVALYPCTQKELTTIENLAAVAASSQAIVLQADQSGLRWLEGHRIPAKLRVQNDNFWHYEEEVGNVKTAYIIGGGHVGLALSKILAMLEFNIVVIDQREGLETLTNNSYAINKHIIDYQTVNDLIPDGEQVYIFIMTHSHRTDQLAVEKLVAKNVGYIGLLGSRHKISQLKKNLSEKVDANVLNRLRAPIGLPIKSHTPAEIAVSIAAELIDIVNAKGQIN